MSNPFQFDWDAPVPDSERDVLLAKIADSVRKRGLQTPAVWFLEIHKPLAPLGGQLAISFSPDIATLFAGGAFDLQKYTRMMRDPSNIDLLIRLIDQSDAETAPARLEGPLAT